MVPGLRRSRQAISAIGMPEFSSLRTVRASDVFVLQLAVVSWRVALLVDLGLVAEIVGRY